MADNPTQTPVEQSRDGKPQGDGHTDALQRAGNPPPPERGTRTMTDGAVTPSDNGKYSPEQMQALWDGAVRANGGASMQMVKGYYEARVAQVNNPSGLLLSSTESPMKLQNDVTVNYPDGSKTTLKAGTELPNGVQFAPGQINRTGENSTITGAGLTVDTGSGSVKLADGTILKTGGTIDGQFNVERGQTVAAGQYVVSRDSVDPKTGEPKIDTYTNKDLSRWEAIEGKPGLYHPSADRMGGTPTEMVQVPKGYDGKFDVSYGGTAPVKEGDWIVKSPKNDGSVGYYRVSEADAAETYLPNDAKTQAAMDASVAGMRANGADLKVAAKTADEYEKNIQEAAMKPGADSKYTDAQMQKLWADAVKANGGESNTMVKGYYEARVTQVTPEANPNGLLISSTESPMTLKSDVTVTQADGSRVTLKAGTELPNGVQLSPNAIKRDGETSTIDGAGLKVDTADSTVKLADGTVLKTGLISGSFSVDKGQTVPAGQYVISRDSVDPKTGEARIDTYTNKDLSRWAEVDGKPGVYHPSADRMGGTPTEMVQVPKGYNGRFDVSYGGTAPITDGDWIVKSGNGFYRVSEADAAETYLPNDPKTQSRMDASVAAMRGAGADIRVAAKTQEAYNDAIAANARPTEQAWRPEEGQFRSSAQTPAGAPDARTAAALADTIPRSVLDAMAVHPDQRSAAQKDEVQKYMKELGIDSEEKQRQVEENASRLGRSVPYVVALATALALAGAVYSTRDRQQTSDTYHK